MVRLISGDKVNLYDKYIVIEFNGNRKTLSTSNLNGGYRDDLTAVFNHNMTDETNKECRLLGATYEEHLKITAKNLGLNPDKTTGIGTAAKMENVSIKTLNFNDLSVTAIVTAGVETNAGRAGDSAKHYLVKEKPVAGTINIILFVNADLSKGALTRALVTCTEAKTLALQELMVDSRYSSGLATGTGTDSTIIISNSNSDLYFDGAGKHTKLGELIGKTVISATKEALEKQNGLNAEKQHDLIRRLRRFDVSFKSVYEKYLSLENENIIDKQLFQQKLNELSKNESIFSFVVMYIHLIDEYKWGLLSEKETKNTAIEILELLAKKFNVTVKISKPVENCIIDLEYLLAEIIQKGCNKV